MPNTESTSPQALGPEDFIVIKKALREMEDSMTRAQAEKDLQKEITKKINEDLQIDKSVFKKMAKTYYKSNFKDVVAADDEFRAMYETVLGGEV